MPIQTMREFENWTEILYYADSSQDLIVDAIEIRRDIKKDSKFKKLGTRDTYTYTTVYEFNFADEITYLDIIVVRAGDNGQWRLKIMENHITKGTTYDTVGNVMMPPTDSDDKDLWDNFWVGFLDVLATGISETLVLIQQHYETIKVGDW